MVGGVLHTHQVSIGPPVQVCVLSTDVSVSGKAWLALAAEHGVREVAEVVAAGVFVAVVTSIQAGITGCTHLQVKGGVEEFKQQQISIGVCSLSLLSALALLACLLAAASSMPCPYGWGPV